MRRRHILVGLTTCFFAAGVVPVGYVKAESATSAEAYAAPLKSKLHSPGNTPSAQHKQPRSPSSRPRGLTRGRPRPAALS